MKMRWYLLGALLASGVSFNTAFAKMVNLYDQPETHSKIVASVDSHNELVPIITNNAGDWMKVGDPRNGNVGWIQVSDMGNVSGMGVSFNQKTVNTKSGPRTIQTIKFSTPQTLTPAQSSKMMQQMQHNTQMMMQQFDQQMNTFWNNNNVFNAWNMPVMMPVLVLPQKAPQTKNTPIKNK